jgi:hypothetical protein
MCALPRMLVEAAKDWMDDKAPRPAAALSYDTAFSLPPLRRRAKHQGWWFSAPSSRVGWPDGPAQGERSLLS